MVSKSTMLTFSFPLSYVLSVLNYGKCNSVNATILSHLVTAKVFSKFMMETIVGSGLSSQHLKLSFERNGSQGVESLFKEQANGKPRVTRCKKIISAVCNHFLDSAMGGN